VLLRCSQLDLSMIEPMNQPKKIVLADAFNIYFATRWPAARLHIKPHSAKNAHEFYKAADMVACAQKFSLTVYTPPPFCQLLFAACGPGSFLSASVSLSAHAFATSSFASFAPGRVAKPAFSMNSCWS
jgi:hypothetical protein